VICKGHGVTGKDSKYVIALVVVFLELTSYAMVRMNHAFLSYLHLFRALLYFFEITPVIFIILLILFIFLFALTIKTAITNPGRLNFIFRISFQGILPRSPPFEVPEGADPDFCMPPYKKSVYFAGNTVQTLYCGTCNVLFFCALYLDFFSTIAHHAVRIAENAIIVF
jgi:hypothetical protein